MHRSLPATAFERASSRLEAEAERAHPRTSTFLPSSILHMYVLPIPCVSCTRRISLTPFAPPDTPLASLSLPEEPDAPIARLTGLPMGSLVDADADAGTGAARAVCEAERERAGLGFDEAEKVEGGLERLPVPLVALGGLSCGVRPAGETERAMVARGGEWTRERPLSRQVRERDPTRCRAGKRSLVHSQGLLDVLRSCKDATRAVRLHAASLPSKVKSRPSCLSLTLRRA